MLRYIFFILGAIASLSSISQTTWFKHLPGWQARNSLSKGDTILTCGMDALSKSFGNKIETFLYWNSINGDSMNFFKINLDTIEQDSTRSSVISYNYTSSIINNFETYHFVNLRYGNKKGRAFIFNLKNFYDSKYFLSEYTIDTFTTAINNLIYLGNLRVLFVPYFIVEKPLERTANTVIYKEKNNKKTLIHEIKNSSSLKYETTCHIKDNTSSKTFFFIMREMWDYAGAPRQWESYIIKMDTLGNELWRVAPNNRDSINPEGMQMVQKPNGNLLVSWCDYWYRPYKNMIGSSEPQLNRKCTVWFAEIDENGKILWRKNTRKYLSLKVIDTTQDLRHSKALLTNNGILWTGYYSYYYFHNYLLKTDFNGNPIWYREYELYKTNTAEQEFKPYDVTATTDGGFVLTGEFISYKSNLFPDGCQLATIIKTDSFGCLEPGCQKNDSQIGIKTIKRTYFKIYPNPANEKITIEFPYFTGDYTISIYSPEGKHIETIQTEKTVNINTSKYKSGLYLFEIYNKNKSEIERHKISIIR